MNVKPLADRVLVEPLEAAEKTSGGLYIPDNAKEKPQKGKVIAAGPGKASDSGTIVKMEVKVGDTILYGKYSGTEVTVDSKEYLIMRESDILAII
ncbi:MAG TPA: co-chaperone GroES [Fibrobacteres bacterium]|jgi:chaperonin GroES|nr:co-chaperone GroES [Fibrobacterota bacterium]